MSAVTFAQIQAEYSDALEAWEAAELRLQAASTALLGAQCGVHFGEGPSDRPGYRTILHCTLEVGTHGDAHANRTSSAIAAAVPS